MLCWERGAGWKEVPNPVALCPSFHQKWNLPPEFILCRQVPGHRPRNEEDGKSSLC